MSRKKTRKMDTAILVALIGVLGTVVAALLSSPLLGKLIDAEKKPASETASAAESGLVFVNGFENGQASGFVFRQLNGR